MSPHIEISGPNAPEPKRERTPAATSQVDTDYSRLEEKLSSLASAVSNWQRDLENSASRSSRLEGAFTVLLSSLEGWKSDIREVASRTESRVLRGLEVIDSRISRVQPGTASPDQGEILKGEILAAIQKLERAFGEKLAMLERDVTAVRAGAASTKGTDALDRRLQNIETMVSASDTELSGRLGASFEILERRLSSIETKFSVPDPEAASRVASGVEALEARLSSIERKLSAPDTQVAGSFEALERRLQSMERKLSEPDTDLPGRLTENIAGLERKVAGGQDRLAEAIAKIGASQQTETLVQSLRTLETSLAESQQRLLEAFSSSKDTTEIDSLTAGLKALETKVAEGQAAVTTKLETVLAEGDENSATQLRYLGSLEELQASVAKRLHALEAVVKNPLDAQQWERLAKGLEFLDVRLAQSLESVSSRTEKAIAGLTSTLDARTAAGQEANLKSAERVWRALRGLEDQITGSYQLVRSSQERLEAATVNVASALEELRAVHGARAGHTEKLLMEGLENLDTRFAQNLMSISERLNTAIFGLNKSTEEWRSDLANSSEESEERVTTRVGQAEAKLAADLKSGLDALGRREERMLALILGGGAAVLPPSREPSEKPE